MRILLFCLVIPFCLYSMDIEKYHPTYPLDFPLKEHSTHPDYERLKNATQEEKDEALKNVLIGSSTSQYPLLRHYTADLLKIGANPNTHRYFFLPANEVVRNNDYHLLKCFIQHGFSINRKITIDGKTTDHHIIFSARTVLMAQLLSDHGANITDKTREGQNVLFDSMLTDYEPELITFYKKKGISPLEYDLSGDSPLHRLANFCVYQDQSLKKASLLLEGLSPQEIIDLISHKNIYHRSPIDRLEGSKDVKENELLNLLKTTLSKAEKEKAQLLKNVSIHTTTILAVFKKRRENLLKIQNNY